VSARSPVSDKLREFANLRDLGGLAATGSMRVRSGQVYRSAILNVAHDEHLDALKALGLKTIIDFRADGERLHAPTPWEEIGCTDYWCREYVSQAGNLARLFATDAPRTRASMREAMIKTYRATPMVHAPSYRVLFERLTTAKTPLLFHCAAGKDRTGVAAALILGALGVSREDIVQDYLQTNAFDLLENLKILGSPANAVFFAAPTEIMEPLLAADADYLEATFDELDKSFGSTENYLSNVLGLDAPQLQQLRAHLLEPAVVTDRRS